MSDREYLIIAAIIMVVVAAIYTLSSDSSSTSSSSGIISAPVHASSKPSAAIPTGPVTCDTAIEQCVAQAQIEIPGCDRAAATQKLSELLASPMENPSCKNLEKSFEKDCPQGCSPDYSSMLTIPGELNIVYQSAMNEYGKCTIRGSRQVRISLRCRAAQ